MWLVLCFFADLTLHFNALNTKLQVEKTAERMFCNIKAFERKLLIFKKDIENGELKYFSNLKKHLENLTIFSDGSLNKQEIFKEFSSIIAPTKKISVNNFCNFKRWKKLCIFLPFLIKLNLMTLIFPVYTAWICKISKWSF